MKCKEEYKEHLLNWWRSLTDEQKKVVPIVNSTIDLRNLFNEVPIGYRKVRNYLREEINMINAELKALGVLFDVEVYRGRLLNWWRSLTEDQKKSVPIANNTIDLRDFFSDAPISHNYLRKHLEKDISRVDAELKSLGVIFDVETYRELLLNWWQSLTDKQKKALPTANNTIDLRNLFSEAPIGYYKVRNYLREEINKINAELKALGVFFDVEVYRERLLNWWRSLTEEQKKSVPIVNNTIDLRDLFSDALVSYNHLRKLLKKDVNRVDAELKSLGVIFDVETYREVLLNWWQSLTDEQKKDIPVKHNTIDFRDLFHDIPIQYHSARKHFKEEINKIEAELKSLGILRNYDDEVVTTLMRGFIIECESNPELLWEVELSTRGKHNLKMESEDLDSYLDKFGFVSTAYLERKLSCTSMELKTLALLELRKKLNQLLLKHGVSLPYCEVKGSTHLIPSDLNYRRIFLKWKNSLTDEEKIALPMIGKVISKKILYDLIPVKFNGLSRSLLYFEYKRLSNEVLELKGIDYKTRKESLEISKQKALEKEQSKISLFRRLRDKKLVSIEDFTSEKGRYEDVQHAFAVTSLKTIAESNMKSYLQGVRHYCDFLESKDVSPDSSFKDCFDSWSLRGFKEYLGKKIKERLISSSTANTLLSTLRMTLKKLKTIRNLNFSYYPADGFEIARESIVFKPYSPNERKQIHEMLEKEMVLAKKKLVPYQKLDRKNANLDVSKNKARIIFEDDCNCVPMYWNIKEHTNGYNKIALIANKEWISINGLYDEWGVIHRKVITRDIGMYVLKMAQVLGMNLNSILDLELDDYQEHHPLTNKPCLTYWKQRSTGEKMLHLDLFHADLQWLSTSQKHFVETVFDEVIQLTSEVRKFAPDEISNKLFITFYCRFSTITEATMSELYSELVDKYHLKDDKGEPLVLTTTRFRPTLVSELIDAEVSIREIQYLLGHASIFTTINYLDTLDFDRVVRNKARKAIEDIYINSVHAIKQSSNQKQQRRFDDCEIIMKTPLGGCKNIFSPPDFIKKSSLYVKGKPCSQYNKCLSCEHVMLTEKHLSELFAMQRDYLSSLESAAVVNTPYFLVVQENLSLLDDILNSETSEFEEDILMRAKEESLFIETTILDSWG